ncbi:MAG: metallophosphoesterase, partial [Pseudomonadota bacterium]
TEPYLQNPTGTGVSVVWLTNFEGKRNRLVVAKRGKYGKKKLRIEATTVKLDRLLEDERSRLEQDIPEVSRRVVYRHEAVVDGLVPDLRYRYRIVSVTRDGKRHRAGPYTLQALPSEGRPLKILLTSDQQERFNTLANYQKVAEQFPRLDAIFFAGDLANHPRRGAEWLDNFQASWRDDPRSARPAFFPALQGTFARQVPETPFTGGALLQHAPLFPAIANHEVSGRFRPNAAYLLDGTERIATINSMYNDPHPRWYAEYRYRQVADTVNPAGSADVREQWIRDNSNDFEAYRDLFTLPDDGPEGESYYSKKIGDVFLISMNVSRIWRTWNINPGDRGKFIEILGESNNPDEWGFGEHIFTPFAEGTAQHDWLEQTLGSDEFRDTKYRVVMFHQSAHGLGDNAVPVLTDPVMHMVYLDDGGLPRTKRVAMPQDNALRQQVFETEVQPLLGNVQEVRYEYPIDSDYFRRDVEPLLHKHGVQLVLTGHSHIWNRSRTGALNFMETSNVGNCFGAFWTRPDGTAWRDQLRITNFGSFAAELEQGPDVSRWNPDNYPRTGDPHGRQPIMPTLANPMVLFEGEPEPVPFVCSNNISTFSILDTEAGAVRSFAFDVREPDGDVVEFDRFELLDD